MRERSSRAEAALAAALADGGEADLGRDIDPRSVTDPAMWGPARQVRAQVLEQLLREGDTSYGAAARLTGVRITGGMRFHYGRLNRPLRLDMCWIDEAVSLLDLTTAGIELVRCRIPTLRTESVDVEGALSARECTIGWVLLADTRVHRSASFEDSQIIGDAASFNARNFSVGGDLLLDRARLHNRTGPALGVEQLRVGGSVGMTGLHAQGAVVLSGATVGGRVDLRGAQLNNGDGVAFDAQYLTAASLRAQQVSCTGTVDLRRASIAGTVSFDAARLTVPGGDALLADDIEADRIQAEGGARFQGRVSLPRGVVRDVLALRGLEVLNPGSQALVAIGANLGTLMADGANFEGRVLLAEIEAASVRLINARVSNPDDSSSINLQSATIRRDLDCTGLRNDGTLDIKSARVGAAVWLSGAHLDGGRGRALAGSRCVVGERFVLGEGSRVRGDIDLAHADVGKSLVFDGAHIEGALRLFQARVRSDVLLRGTYIETPGMAIDAIGLTVDGRFTCRGLVSDGGVRLTAAVADAVVMTGAQIHNPEANALIASRVNVRGDFVVGNDPYSGDSGGFWAAGRVVFRDAQVGGDLIFDDAELSKPDHRALDVTSIRVGGKLSLEGTRIDGAAALDKAHVLRRIVVSNAEFAGHGVGSADGPVVFSALQTTADELLVDGGTFSGAVRLTGSNFAVGASIRGATVSASGAIAVLASELTCGVLHLTTLDVDGEVSLTGCQVANDLLVEGGSYRNPGEAALDLSRSVVAGTLSVADADVVGTLLLRRADVGFSVLLTATDLDAGVAGPTSHSPTAGVALTAAGMRVEGNVELRQVTARGQLSLRDVLVTGRLIVRDGCVLESPGTAVYAPGLKVAGSVEIGHNRLANSEVAATDSTAADVSVVGGVRLDRSHLGEIWFHEVSISRAPGLADEPLDEEEPLVNLSEAEVARRISMDGLHVFGDRADSGPTLIDLSEVRAGSVELPQGGTAIDLRDAEVRSLMFDLADPETVLLSGLSFDDPGGADVETALAWLRRDPTGFQHQAYEQLAAHYQRQGDEPAARAVLLARQRHRRDLLGGSVGQLITKGWGHLQDATVGYGYRPGLAAVWFLGLLAFGSAFFWGRGLDPIDLSAHPTFNPIGYTLDLLIPLVNLGQDLAWNPVGADLVVAYTLTFAGAVLATTVAAAVTRVLTRR